MLYTKLKRREKAIKDLTELGVMPMSVMRNMQIFEFYSSLPEKLCVYCKYELTAEQFNISSDHVKTIILNLKKNT